ncbi:MAG: LPS export ABC transporter periplasmic protein LptC [Candidatus Omnitrophica bacterium]|nr:LPS export ABC transporter periplasmic protein LptC [Candidatus Omnitrophota bacterium]
MIIRLILTLILFIQGFPVFAEAPEISQKIEGFNLEGYAENGDKSWDLKGDKADIVGNKVAVSNVNANSYGQEDMNLTAKRGTINKATGDVNLQQDVVITAERGAVMKTDTLEWSRQKDLVQTDDPVTIEDKSMRVQGIGLEAHPSMKDATLKSDVMADIQAESGTNKNNRIQITSDGPMELDQATMTAVFTVNVVAIEPASGRRLKADRMEVLFDDQTKKIKEITCTGNVEVQQENNITRSESMVYKADEQRMVLTGRPKLIIDPGDNNAKGAFKF